MLSFLGWGSKSPSTTPSKDNNSTPSPSPPPPTEESSQQAQQEQPLHTPPTNTLPTETPGLNKNLKLLFGGLTFLSLSLLITRRAYRKRILSSIPPYYTSSTYHKPYPPISGATDALEAFSLATINVFSFSMVFSGGVLYALDVNSMEDLRRIARRGFAGDQGVIGDGKSDEELEEEIEAWVVSVLGRKAEREFQREKERFSREREGEGEGQNESGKSV